MGKKKLNFSGAADDQYTYLRAQIQRQLKEFDEFDSRERALQIRYGVEDAENVLFNLQRIVYRFHVDLQINILLDIEYFEGQRREVTSIPVLYFKKVNDACPIVFITSGKTERKTHRFIDELPLERRKVLRSKMHLKSHIDDDDWIIYKPVHDVNATGKKDLKKIDRIFDRQQKIDIDHGRSVWSMRIEKIVKAVFIFLFFSVVVFSTFMMKFSLLRMVAINDPVILTSSNTSKWTDNQTTVPWALFTTLMCSQGFLWCYAFFVFMFGKDLTPCSYINVFKKYWLILVNGCLSAFAEVMLVMLIYPSVDAVSIHAVMLASLLMPSVLNVVDGFTKGKTSWLHKGCDAGAIVMFLIVYVLGVVDYTMNTAKTDALVIAFLIICPLISSARFWVSWLRMKIPFLYSTDSTPEDCRRKLGFIGATLNWITGTTVALIMVYCYDSPVSKNNFDWSHWPLILGTLVGGFLVTYFCYVSCQIGNQRAPMGLGCIFGMLTSLITSAIFCDNALNNPGYTPQLFCGSSDPGMPFWINALLTAIFGLIGWVLALRHIFLNPIKVLSSWRLLFTQDVFCSAAGLSDIEVVLNRRRFMVSQKKYEELIGIQGAKTIRRKAKKEEKKLKKTKRTTSIASSAMSSGSDSDGIYAERSLFRASSDVLRQFENDDHRRKHAPETMDDGFSNPAFDDGETVRIGSVGFKEPVGMKKIPARHRKLSKQYTDKEEKVPYIFICPTFYRETYDEMKTITISLLRLNRDQITNVHKRYKFDVNIFFDNCYLNGDHGRTVNEYVVWLTEIMLEVGHLVSWQGFEGVGDNGEHLVPIKKPEVTLWPYGIRLEYTLPYPKGHHSPNKFYVHLKDPEKIQKGKRWSQSMYFYYLLGYKFEMHMDKKLYDSYILALDGDINFQPVALHTVLDTLRASPNIGICCGRIHPQGYGPIYYYQKFEYAIGHWLQKATEHVIGCVLCSPGCFSLVRGEALIKSADNQIDSSVAVYRSRAHDALTKVQWNQGEDRWLCTLMMQRGWRIEYVAISDSLTNAPTGMKEFFNQRRRWVPSTLFNTYDVITSWRTTTKINDSISIWYIIYQVVLTLSGLLAPMTLIFLVAGSISVLWSFMCPMMPNPDFCMANIMISSLNLSLLPAVIFACLCYWGSPEWQHRFVKIMTYIYALIMCAVMVVLIAGLFETNDEGVTCGFCNVSNQFFLFLVALYLIAGILHPSEFECLPAGAVYYLMMPTMFIMLNIYSFTGLNNMSWGTREGKADGDAEGAGAKFALCSCKLGKLCMCKCCYVPMEWFGIKKNKNYTGALGDGKVVVDQPQKEVKKKQVLRIPLTAINNECEYDLESNPVLQKTLRPVNTRQNAETRREIAYWEELISKYLYVAKPLNKAQQREITDGLAGLRDKFLILFYGLNVTWLVLVIAVTIESENIEMSVAGIACDATVCPPSNLNPLSLFFLLFYLVLLTIQFTCMVLHRWGSLLTYLAQVNLFKDDLRVLDGFLTRDASTW